MEITLVCARRRGASLLAVDGCHMETALGFLIVRGEGFEGLV